MQSSALRTGTPSNSDNRRATGSMRKDSTTWPLGRPRWLTRITRAPARRRCSMVGMAARMRLSSVISPSFNGTLKSTRTRTRLPFTSRSATPSLAPMELLPPVHVFDQVDDSQRVAPLVVVPGDDLDQVAIHHPRQGAVDDGGAGIAQEVAGHQRLVGDAQDALHGALCRPPERLIDLLRQI